MVLMDDLQTSTYLVADVDAAIERYDRLTGRGAWHRRPGQRQSFGALYDVIEELRVDLERREAVEVERWEDDGGSAA